MKARIESIYLLAVITVSMIFISALPVAAADKYSSGAKTWDTTPNTWGSSSNGPYDTATWDNTAPDSAIFEGTAGTVTLGAAISISNLTINIASYTIRSNTLSFASGGTITGPAASVSGVTLSSGITGSPNMTQNNLANLSLNPTSGNMTLGTITRGGDNWIYLGGTTTGNSIASIPKGHNNAKLGFNGTGKWTFLGNVYAGEMYIDSGEAVANGELSADFNGIFLRNTGVLHYNNAGAVKGPSTGSSSTLKFYIDGGSIDNSSGSAIATSAWNPQQQWRGDWTFIGSGGASSDLYLGTGPVTLSPSSFPVRKDIKVTVSNSLTTLTIGGVIGGSGRGLAKAGAGKLVLTGNNSYTGDTIVNEGLLDVRVASTLSNCSAIQLDSSGTLRLENADNAGSVWDFAALSALNPNLRARFDPATAGNLTFTENVAGYTDVTATVPNPDSTAYWVGGAGTWDNTASNWRDAATGGSSIAWDADNTDNDTAVFGGTAGKVELGTDISLRRMEINSANYQIGGDTETEVLNFGSLEPRITTTGPVTIKAGITGSPELIYNIGGNQILTLAPTGGVSMTMGMIHRRSDDYLYLSGTSTGNSAAGLTIADDRTKLRKYGSGTWTINGNVAAHGEIYIYEGRLVLNGDVRGRTTTAFAFPGALPGTLAGTGTLINLAVTVPAGRTLAPGNPTGTLTVTGQNCTINGNLDITVNGAQNSTLAVGNTLTISSATLNVNTVSTPPGPVIIATYGTLSGQFAATNMISSWTVDYTYQGGNAIALIPPPSGTLFIIK